MHAPLLIFGIVIFPVTFVVTFVVTDATLPCDPNPCQNGGICLLSGGEQSCICGDIYKGEFCTLGPCNPNPCLNGGNCTITDDMEDNFSCSCASGYEGRNCEDDLCSLYQCKNGGECYIEEEKAKCRCKDPFSGETCEQGPCDPNPCENYGDCKLNGSTFICRCLEGFKGNTCERSPCNPNPCLHDGTCAISYDVMEDDFSCSCASGYEGRTCKNRSLDIATSESPTSEKSTATIDPISKITNLFTSTSVVSNPDITSMTKDTTNSRSELPTVYSNAENTTISKSAMKLSTSVMTTTHEADRETSTVFPKESIPTTTPRSFEESTSTRDNTSENTYLSTITSMISDTDDTSMVTDNNINKRTDFYTTDSSFENTTITISATKLTTDMTISPKTGGEPSSASPRENIPRTTPRSIEKSTTTINNTFKSTELYNISLPTLDSTMISTMKKFINSSTEFTTIPEDSNDISTIISRSTEKFISVKTASTKAGQKASTTLPNENISTITSSALEKSTLAFDDDVDKKTDSFVSISTVSNASRISTTDAIPSKIIASTSDSPMTSNVIITTNGISSEYSSDADDYTSNLFTSTEDEITDIMEFKTVPSTELKKHTLTTSLLTDSSTTSSDISTSTKDETAALMIDTDKSHVATKDTSYYIGFGVAGSFALVSLLASSWYIKRKCKGRSRRHSDYATSEISVSSNGSDSNLV